MPWVRYDDQYPINRKVSGLSDKAFRLHTSAIFWCSRNGTDGFIPADDLEDTCPKVRPPARFAAECVRRRLWHVTGEECDSETCPAHVDNRPDAVDIEPGWIIHDYLEYQPSAQKVSKERKAKAERQRKWIESKRRRSRDASLDPSQDGATNGQKDDAPSPPRPEGSGAGTAPSARGPRAAANGRASPPGSPPAAKSKPPWCGQCDNDHTRYVEIDGRAAPCPRCHPRAAQEVL